MIRIPLSLMFAAGAALAPLQAGAVAVIDAGDIAAGYTETFDAAPLGTRAPGRPPSPTAPVRVGSHATVTPSVQAA